MMTYIRSNAFFLIGRFLWILLFFFLIFLTYFFYVPKVIIGGYEIINPVYDFFSKFDWWLHILVYVSILSLITAVILLFTSAYFIYSKARRLVTEKELEDKFTSKMIDYLYSDYFDDVINYDKTYKYFKKNVKSKSSLEVFFRVIVKTQNLISEDFRFKFNQLVEEANISKRLKYFLYSHDKSKKIIAFKVASSLQIKGYEREISKYITHKNYALRYEAIVAYVRLSETNNLDFLLTQKYHLSKLTINTIYNAIDRSLKVNNSNYQDMIKSPLSRVNVTGSLLGNSIDNRDQRELVKSALEDNDELLREVAWELYTSNEQSAIDVDFLLNKFATESQENKIHIMKAIQKIELNDSVFSFLDTVIKNESILLKVYALRLLFEHNVTQFFKYQEMDDERIAIACREVADFNII